MSGFVSKSLSKILKNKDDTEKLYSDILDNSSDKKQLDFKNHENNEFVIKFEDDINISKNNDDN